jgi:cytochrome d ubiquinol oxidase subunit II
MIAVGSFLPSLLLGTAFANLAQGIPINENMMFTGNLFTLLNPYGLLGGLATTAVFLLHGANFLGLKLEGELRQRTNALAKKLWIAASVLFSTFAVYSYVSIYLKRDIIDPGIAPLAAVVFLLLSGYFINKKMEGWAFIMSSLHIVLAQVSFYLMTFPNVMISSTNPDWTLTIYNASSSQYTLTVMSIVALIFVPIVLVYQGWTYYMFAKRVSTDKKTLVY